MNYSRRNQLAQAFGRIAGEPQSANEDDWYYDVGQTVDPNLNAGTSSPSHSSGWNTHPSYEDTSFATEGTSIFNTDEQNAMLTGGHGEPQRRDDIKRIQMALKRIPIDPGPADGIFGPKTCGAILEFQKNKYGTAKQNFLDYQTFLDLGFDVHTADRFAKNYGWICGATAMPASEAEGQAATGGGVVGIADIKKIQRKVGTRADGKWGPKTCGALYDLQAKTGIYTNVLRSSTFEKLGFTGSEAQRYAGAFASVCAQYYSEPVPGGSDGNQVKVTEQDPPIRTGPGEPTPVVQPQQAGMGLWPLLGIGIAGLVGYYAMKKGKKGKRR